MRTPGELLGEGYNFGMSNLLAYSTLGCPAWDLETILTNTVAFGYDAIELRGYLDVMDLPLAAPFTPENRAETRRKLTDAGIAVCCVSSSGVVAQGNLDHVKRHCELAHELGAPHVRIFGGKPESSESALTNLAAFGDAAADAGVSLVLETHDDFSTGETVAALLSEAAHPAVFSLWDLHHPYRQGEAMEDTHRLLAPTLRHIHIKDGVAGTGYTLLGEGDIPVFPMLALALDSGYTGAISLEWEKRWHPEISDPELAFPQYASAVRTWLKTR